jgi:hypothetical protein
MRELVTGKNTIGPEVIDPGGRSVEKPREVTLIFKPYTQMKYAMYFIASIYVLFSEFCPYA